MCIIQNVSYSNLEPQEAESETLQLQFCLSDLGNACRFCIVLMLHAHCICVGMGSINVVSYISILEKEGNISVIYNSERRCFISKKPLFPFSLQMLFSTVTKACFKWSYKASSPVCWKVITYMQTMNVLIHAFFLLLLFMCTRALSKSSALSTGENICSGLVFV